MKNPDMTTTPEPNGPDGMDPVFVSRLLFEYPYSSAVG